MLQIAATEWQQDLTEGGEHSLVLSRENEQWCLTLECIACEKFSVLRQALKKNLFIRIDGVSRAFEEIGVWESVRFPVASLRCEVFLGAGECVLLLALELQPKVVVLKAPYSLSPIETRYLAETGRVQSAAFAGQSPQTNLRTDLHVHFAGCVRAHHLIALGVEYDIHYPLSLLAEAGIRTEGTGAVPLRSLTPRLLQSLQRQLSIPIDRQITFLELEQIYRLRAPVTKSPLTFVALCRQIACDYQAMGVGYVELSMSSIIETARLNAAMLHLPAIEQESGVQIRFLAAMSRHDDPEWALDYCERLKQLVKCRYIAGVDFMGHETNSTHAFSRTIKALAQWADRERPGYVLRVHAGENPAYPENVRVAVESIGSCNVQLRIGHGLYGVDKHTLAEIRRKGVIVEFNLNSNLALNNIQALDDIPLNSYLNAGVSAVLGTDGYGIYQSSLSLELRAALLAGVSALGVEALIATESRYLARQAAHELRSTLPVGEYAVPLECPARFFTPQVVVRTRREKENRDRRLKAHLAGLNIPLLGDKAIHRLLDGKRCICIAGAWANSWNAISPAGQSSIRTEMQFVIESLDPARDVIVTGGTHFGVEHIVQQNARSCGITILGALVCETPPDSIDSITHACLVGESLYDKAAGLYRLMQKYGGLCLFIGGGNIVSDEIQTACNLRLRYLLMDGPEGASTRHAREQPARAFKTGAEVLAVLGTMPPFRREAFWHPGPNPMVDIVLLRENPRDGSQEVLLIQRHHDVQTESGKWALPGGFRRTDAPRGSAWIAGSETARQACVRELREESGLDLSDRIGDLIEVGDFAGEGRDPRDTPVAWSLTTVFAYRCPLEVAIRPISGGDDASDARWVPLSSLSDNMAFDHQKILRQALEKLLCGVRQSSGAIVF